MIKGVLPSNTKAASAGCEWESVFGRKGFFEQPFSRSKIDRPPGLTGATPREAIFNALGSKAETGNLLIPDARLNPLEPSI